MTTNETTALKLREVRIGDYDDAAVVFDLPNGDVLPFPLEVPAARALDRELKGLPAEPATVPGLLENAIKHLEGRVARVEIGFNPRPGPLVHLVLESGGKETRMPARLGDAIALAHRHKAPIAATADAVKWMHVGASETGASVASMDWNETYRLVSGFTALGRTDDAIAGVLRFRELQPGNEAWCGLLGRLYLRKGWRTSAAREMARTVAWALRGGYVDGVIGGARDIARIDLDFLPVLTLRAPALIEDFHSPRFENEWWSGGDAVPYPGDPKRRAYRLGDDQDWFILKLGGTQTWESARTVRVDLHLAAAGTSGSAHVAIDVGGRGFDAPLAALQPGWNRLSFDLTAAVWRHEEEAPVALAAPVVGPVKSIWLLFGSARPAGEILLSDFRLE